MVKIRVEDIELSSMFLIWRMDGCPDPEQRSDFMTT